MAETPIIPGISVIGTGPQTVGHSLQTENKITLPNGAVMQGTVQGQNSAGQMVVQADNLTLILQTQFQLPKGTMVQLRIDPPVLSEQSQQFRILTVNGQTLPAENNPPAAALQKLDTAVARLMKEQVKPIGYLMDVIRNSPTAPKADAPLPEAGTTRNLAQAAVMGTGKPVEATLLKPLANLPAVTLLSQIAARLGQSVAHSAEWLTPGLKMQVRLLPKVLDAQLPPSPTGNAALPVAEQKTPPLSGLALQARAAYGMKWQAAQLPPLQSVMQPQLRAEEGVKLPLPATPPVGGEGKVPQPPLASGGAQAFPPVMAQQTLPPARVEQLLAQAQPMLPSPQVAAVVVGKEANGNVLLASRLGMVSFPAPQGSPAQVGDVFPLDVVKLERPNLARYEALMQQTASPLSLARTVGSSFTHLNELSALLHGLQNSFAAQALQRVVPHIGSHLAAGILLFMQLMKKGDVESWLGKDTVDLLERMGKGDLVRSLGQEVQLLRNVFTGAEANQWQPVFLPIMVEKEINTARMFVRYEEEEAKKDKGKGGGFHFVVEVDLSMLGAMQFDGMVKVKGQKLFDLQLYTLKPLPVAMKEEIQQLFYASQEATGMVGGIQFRQMDVFPLNPMRDLLEASSGTASGGIMA